MTYCLAIKIDEGLVFASDSRTSAGVDHVNTYSKMHTFIWPGKRYFALLSSGNLATTQAVVKRIRMEGDLGQGLASVPNMDMAASYVGRISKDVQLEFGGGTTSELDATFILGGEITGGDSAIFLVYPQGNYIHESTDHPFLQIGETKYGKPILDRVVRPDISLELAARCALVSVNSTIRSNLTVGPPIELLLYRHGSFGNAKLLVFNDDNPFYHAFNEAWNEGLRLALNGLPKFDWEEDLKMAQFVQDGTSSVMR